MTLEPVHIVADMAIEAPAAEVWRFVGAFDDAALGQGFVSAVTSVGEGVGALRTLHLLPAFGGGKVVERQTARDDKGYYYAYELEDPAGLPFVDYYASALVASADPASCRVIWLNRYFTDAAAVNDMRKQSLAILEAIETNLRTALGLNT